MDKKNSAPIIFGVILIIALIIGLLTILYTFVVVKKDVVEEEKLPENNITEKIDGNIKEEKEIQDEEDFEIEVGKKAPNFTLKNLEGEEVSLEDYRGKIVLLNFWATWCGYCDKEMPDMQKLDTENDDVVVLAIDVMEEKKIVEKYIEKGGYDFQVLLDEKGDLSQTYLVSAFPTSYFIDKEGILLGGVPGMMTSERMNQIIDEIRENE